MQVPLGVLLLLPPRPLGLIRPHLRKAQPLGPHQQADLVLNLDFRFEFSQAKVLLG